tara:strand:+ start:227 stop:343 length:117 start_codon:yes stop_codon:yes gene_type:complete
MKKEASSNFHGEIDVPEERIKELKTKINHWEVIKALGF